MYNFVRIAILFVLSTFTVVFVSSQGSSPTTKATETTTPPSPSTTSPPSTVPTTTLTPQQECAKLNSSCNVCVKNPKCLWCNKGSRCMVYPVGHIIPRVDDCDLNDARWGTCWVNFKVLLIVMGVLAGVILIFLTCCIYCCCCRSNKAKNKRKYMETEAKWEREREERQARSDERRAARMAKHDEIRRKYGINPSGLGIEVKGLIKDETPYQRFDA